MVLYRFINVVFQALVLLSVNISIIPIDYYTPMYNYRDQKCCLKLVQQDIEDLENKVKMKISRTDIGGIRRDSGYSPAKDDSLRIFSPSVKVILVLCQGETVLSQEETVLSQGETVLTREKQF